MNIEDVTNPGLVNVVDQGDGLVSVDQTIQVTRSPAAANQVAPVGDGLGGNPVTVTNPGLVDVVDETTVPGAGLARNVFP